MLEGEKAAFYLRIWSNPEACFQNYTSVYTFCKSNKKSFCFLSRRQVAPVTESQIKERNEKGRDDGGIWQENRLRRIQKCHSQPAQWRHRTHRRGRRADHRPQKCTDWLIPGYDTFKWHLLHTKGVAHSESYYNLRHNSDLLLVLRCCLFLWSEPAGTQGKGSGALFARKVKPASLKPPPWILSHQSSDTWKQFWWFDGQWKFLLRSFFSLRTFLFSLTVILHNILCPIIQVIFSKITWSSVKQNFRWFNLIIWGTYSNMGFRPFICFSDFC